MNNYWNSPVTIGNLTFPRFMSGPLDGITDSPFRKLVRKFSTSELLYTEMRHIRCIANKRGAELALNFEQMERPLNFQIAANSLECIPQAIEKILEKGVDCVDINVGCPAKNVVRSGGGSSLMADPKRLEEILKELRKHLPIPFTVKIRAGFKQANAIDIAKLVQDCGADALAIHPRLQTQRFAGRPDYALAAEVKKNISIPLLLSGNVVNFKTAQLAYNQTGVDGFLIGRGMWAKPWKLKEMLMHSQGKDFIITPGEVLACALEHLDLMIVYYGPHGLYCFRKHLPFYLKGFMGASEVRQKLAISQSVAEVREGLMQFFMGQLDQTTPSFQVKNNL
jgi:tRNA-dihydrouridine synthase B